MKMSEPIHVAVIILFYSACAICADQAPGPEWPDSRPNLSASLQLASRNVVPCPRGDRAAFVNYNPSPSRTPHAVFFIDLTGWELVDAGTPALRQSQLAEHRDLYRTDLIDADALGHSVSTARLVCEQS